ncbi:MAG: hypothetical protein OCD76_21485 [Reichenbachiella sp.]
MNELIKPLSVELLSGEEVFELLGIPTKFPKELVEELSIETAVLYSNGTLNFDEADCIVNNLWGLWTTNDNYFKDSEYGDISRECYEAFDAGEYIRSTDGEDVDPELKYTKPLIEALLKKVDNMV